MKKNFIFLSLGFILIFFIGCSDSLELPNKQINLKNNKLTYLYDDEYKFLEKNPIVIEKNNIIYLIFTRKIDNKEQKYAVVVYHNNGWKLEPLVKLSKQKFNNLLNTGYKVKVIKNDIKDPLSYICFCKNNILEFKIKHYINMSILDVILDIDGVQSKIIVYINKPLKVIEKFFLEGSFWNEDKNPNIISKNQLTNILNFFFRYKNYLKSYVLNDKIVVNTEIDKVMKVVQIAYQMEEGNPKNINKLYNELKTIKIHGSDTIYDYTDIYPIIKRDILSVYLQKLANAQSIEEIYKYINIYSVDKGKFFIDLNDKTKKFEQNKIKRLLKKEMNTYLSEHNYKAFDKLFTIIKNNIENNKDFTGLVDWPETYYRIILNRLLNLYFPKRDCGGLFDVENVAFQGDASDYDKWTKGCIKCKKGFHGGYRLYKICGTLRDGVINKGTITATYYSYNSWQTKTYTEKFNSYAEEKNAAYRVREKVVIDWNHQFDMEQQEQERENDSHGVEITNCTQHSCTILYHNSYSGVITWNYNGNYYNFSLSGGWGIYYTDGELKTKCGKTEVNSLNEAINKTVKCAYYGHY